MLERAASFEGKTVCKFILSSALDRAKRTIKEHEGWVAVINRALPYLISTSGHT